MIFSKPLRDYEQCVYYKCGGCGVCYRLVLNFNIRTVFINHLLDWFLEPRQTIIDIADFVNFIVFHYHMLVHSPVTWTREFFCLQQKMKEFFNSLKSLNFVQVTVTHSYSVEALIETLAQTKSIKSDFLNVFFKDRFRFFGNKFNKEKFDTIESELLKTISIKLQSSTKSDLDAIDIFGPFVCGRTRQNKTMVDNDTLAYFRQFLVESFLKSCLKYNSVCKKYNTTVLFKVCELIN